MSIPAVLLPLFVQVTLTLGLLCWLGVMRRGDLHGAVALRDIALGQPNWTPHTMQVGNAFANQFELPVLFYLLTVLAMATRHADLLFVVLAWVFVLSRLAHAFEHTTTNRVRRRGMIYGVGMLVLVIMWAIFSVRILLGLG
jgi:hypothetical protein